MPVLAYIDPGTTSLVAQFAAAGFAGVVLYLRSRFSRKKAAEASPAPNEEPAEERS